MKDIIKKYFKVTETINKTKKSVNEISLRAVDTLSLSNLKNNFVKLLDDGEISKKEFDAIFSKETIKELRPYKGELMNLSDTDMGIISKDYVSDIISYIIGIKLPSASSPIAWKNAKTFVNEKLNITKELFNIPDELPEDIFVANNYKKVIHVYKNPKYHNYSVPVMEKTIYNDETTFTQLSFVVFYSDQNNLSTEDILERKESVIKEHRESFDDENNNHSNKNIWAFSHDVTEVLEVLLKEYSLDDLDFSKTLSPEGMKYRLPLLERHIHYDETEDPDYDDYLDMMF